MYQLSDDVLEYLRGGIAVQVATASPTGRPQATNAWGPRWNGDGTITLFLDTAAAGQTLANLAVNGKIAVITADPVSYRSIQFKGKWLSASQPTDDDRDWVSATANSSPRLWPSSAMTRRPFATAGSTK